MKKNSRKSDSSNAPGTADGGEPVVLGENLEIADAGALLGQLKAVIETRGSVVLDGSQVRVIDTAILQLLVALFRQAQQQETRIAWQQPSDALCKTAALLGLKTCLYLPSTKLGTAA